MSSKYACMAGPYNILWTTDTAVHVHCIVNKVIIICTASQFSIIVLEKPMVSNTQHENVGYNLHVTSTHVYTVMSN